MKLNTFNRSLRRFSILGLFIGLGFGAVACTGPDNVASCNEWLESASCGDFDFSASVDCSVYENTDCDISEYFECLTANTSCDEGTGVPDVSGWGQCAAKATC